jgi:hypothetical protein
MGEGFLMYANLQLVEYVSITELLLCVVVLFLMWKKKAIGEHSFLAMFLAVRAVCGTITVAVLFFRSYLGLSKLVAYNIYFFSYWPIFVIQAVLMVLVVYGIYNLALAPFEPLKKLGSIVFRWIAAIAVAVTIGVAIGPHMSGTSYLANLIGQFQQTAGVLTLCLLLFVCFALRPLGLTERSRAFGASLGLGVLAATQLVLSAWSPTSAALSPYSIVYFYAGLGSCAALLVWGVYFALPEPERRMVLLPTTSPYFFWNKISEALGDKPGFVAINGFSPDLMAPGELDAMIVASQPRVLEQAPRVMQPIAVNR